MSVDAATVRHVARLARIAVTEEEIPALATELSAILTMVEKLGEADVTGIEPLSAVHAMPLPRRADQVTAGGIREDVLANAPESEAGFFAVPKVVE